MGDDFDAALTDLLASTMSVDPVTRSRAAGEIRKLLEANNQPIHEPGEPRFYDRDVRPALRTRPLTEDEEARILQGCSDAFLTTDPERTQGRVWFLSAMAAGRPQFTTAQLLSLFVEHIEELDPKDAFIAVMALLDLMTWTVGPDTDAIRDEVVRSDPRPSLERLAGSSPPRDAPAGAAAIALRQVEALIGHPRAVPAGGRFRVQLGSDDEPRDIVVVWAQNEDEAIDTAISFIRSLDRDDPGTKPTAVERIGDAPHPSDLGVARRYDEVDHVFLDGGGRRRSTAYHVELGDVAEMTTAFRTGDAFAATREELRALGVDPTQAAVMTLVADEHGGSPWLVIVLAPDDRVWTWRGPQTDLPFDIQSGWSEDDVVTLDLDTRRWMRVAKRLLREERDGRHATGVPDPR